MNDYTPTTNDMRTAWTDYRSEDLISNSEAIEEFQRWLIAHDQGIRDSVKPPKLTAKEHLKAAFDKAHPVPEGRDVPTGVTIIARRENGKIWVLATGLTSGAYDDIEVRTLEPLPPVIPDDCDLVWASRKGDRIAGRLVWHRQPGIARHLWKTWRPDGCSSTATEDDLIDPVPVPPESEARS